MPVPRRLVRAFVALALAASGLFYLGFLHTPPGPRSMRRFDPDRLADLELAMWQAYYAHENVRLFRLLVMAQREQYRYSWAKAAVAAHRFARAAARFAVSRSDYDRLLPDLERGYGIARDWTREPFDARAVARAELAWWAARRTPGQEGAARVGERIAEEYALLYRAPRSAVLEAALRRAEAAALRDRGGRDADWPRIRVLLRASYGSLRAAVAAPGG
jgi:hypothetical protein